MAHDRWEGIAAESNPHGLIGRASHEKHGPPNVSAAQARGARSVALEPRLLSARLVACCGLLASLAEYGREISPASLYQRGQLLPDTLNGKIDTAEIVEAVIDLVAKLHLRIGEILTHGGTAKPSSESLHPGAILKIQASRAHLEPHDEA